ncbi:MAG: hypothetical protein JNM86_12335 [Phycisphaerae bacterium]|nr:hypothetical protein [Phycisphaerae bacterium]
MSTRSIRAANAALMFLIALIHATLIGCASGPAVTARDLDRLTGPAWKGTLTYRDYTTGKPTAIDSTLSVVKQPGLAQVGNDFADAGVAPAWEFRVGYPREPDHDSTRLVRISPSGDVLDGERVTRRVDLPADVVEITTEKDGTDNDAAARFRFVYVIAPTRFSIVKLVRPAEQAEFFERNRYEWSRPPHP